jgi:hypothetical protein
LKLQLQREQLLQEAERKTIENHHQESVEPKVEMQSIGLDVPPQILQVSNNSTFSSNNNFKTLLLV